MELLVIGDSEKMKFLFESLSLSLTSATMKEGLTIEHKKELIIDLQSLGLSSHNKNGFVVFYQQYNAICPEPSTNVLLCLLRRILRELGHKITKIENCYDDDFRLVQEGFTTDIPESDGELYRLTWNKYVEDVFEEM